MRKAGCCRRPAWPACCRAPSRPGTCPDSSLSIMTQPRSFRAEAVVLRHMDWGEADRLLTLYTREHGKVRAVAKGARRIKSRKAGHLEPFTKVVLQLAQGRDLLIVTQADTLEAPLSIGADLEKTGYASYVVEL